MDISSNEVQERKATQEIQQTGSQREEGIAIGKASQPVGDGNIRGTGTDARQENQGRAHQGSGKGHQAAIYPRDEETDVFAGQATYKTC